MYCSKPGHSEKRPLCCLHRCLPDRLALAAIVEGTLDHFAACIRYACETWKEVHEDITHPAHPLQGRPKAIGPLIGTTLMLLLLSCLLAGTVVSFVPRLQKLHLLPAYSMPKLPWICRNS